MNSINVDAVLGALTRYSSDLEVYRTAEGTVKAKAMFLVEDTGPNNTTTARARQIVRLAEKLKEAGVTP